MKKLEQALEAEIDYLKHNRRNSNYTLANGILITLFKTPDSSLIRGYYRFENVQFLNLRSEEICDCIVAGTIHTAIIEHCDRYCIEISIEGVGDDSLESIILSVQSWKLTELQLNRLKTINNNKILMSMEREHKAPGNNFKEFEYGQELAFKRAISNPITAIWGPPGTGKTYTLARIAIALMKRGKRVLIMSQSNMAVDSSVLQIRKILEITEDKETTLQNRILRFGMVHSEELAECHSYLSWDVAFNSFPEKELEYESLSEEMRQSKEISQERIKEIKEKRKHILEVVSNKELDLIARARILATTATKATLNDVVYSQHWDAVIFDEVSMAYVTQIAIAASMAQEHLILVGDFRQLSPIVISPNASALKEDIFSYLHITRSNGMVNKHPWLVMLNEQWRMHPEIAEFANKRIYGGKIKTAPASVERNMRIASTAPFPMKAFAYVDYSDYQGTCFSTSKGSRFNLFSASIAMSLALTAVKGGNDVGIVTPYAAQSRLINAMITDSERITGNRYGIHCSTVHQFQGSEKAVIIFDTVESFPKSSAGKIVSDGEDDHAMRLVNVALTRAKGKFIIIGNSEFFREQMDLSDDMRSLIHRSRDSYHLKGEDLLNFLENNHNSGVFHLYRNFTDALKPFKESLERCRKPSEIQYWHSVKNYVSVDSPYAPKEFLDNLKKSDAWKRVYSTEAAKNTIGIELRKVVRPIAAPPVDDFTIIGDRQIWWNIPKVTNTRPGRRLTFSIDGKETVLIFSKMTELKESIDKALDLQKQENASRNDFYIFSNSRFKCSTCDGGTPVFKKSSKGTYYVVCKDCSNVISPYIPKEIVEEYIDKNEIRCSQCGGKIKVSRKYWSVYCENDFGHKGIKFNDLIEKPLSSFKSKFNQPSMKDSSILTKKVILVKASKKE